MRSVPLVHGAQGMCAGKQTYDGNCALPCASRAVPESGLPLIFKDHRAGCGKAILAGNGHGNAGLGAAAVIAGLRGHGGLRGLRAGRGNGGKCQDQAQSCKPVKPQTAAEETSHVHLLQKIKNVRTPRMWEPESIVSGAGSGGLTGGGWGLDGWARPMSVSISQFVVHSSNWPVDGRHKSRHDSHGEIPHRRRRQGKRTTRKILT